MFISFDLVGYVSLFWITVLAICLIGYKYKRDKEYNQMIDQTLDEYEWMQELAEQQFSVNDELQAALDKMVNNLCQMNTNLESMNDHVDSLTISNVITQFAMSDGFEIDTVYDTVTGRETVCEPYKKDNPQLPLEFMIDVSLDDDLVYSVVVPKTVFSAIKRMLRAKVEHQGATNLPQSERKFQSDIISKPHKPAYVGPRHTHPMQVADTPPSKFDPANNVPTINPELDAIMAKLSKTTHNNGNSSNGEQD